jgi:hypothetical protein
MMNRGSTVDIVTAKRLDIQGVQIRVSVGQEFSLLHIV